MSDPQTIALVISSIGCAVLVLDKVSTLAKGWQKAESAVENGQTTTAIVQSTTTQLAVMQAEISGLRRDFTAWMERHDSQNNQIQELRDRVARLEAKVK